MITAAWRGGPPVPVSEDPVPPLVEGVHAFRIVALFEVSDPSRQDHILDRENLRAVVPGFCWWCKSARDDGTPCPGRPN